MVVFLGMIYSEPLPFPDMHSHTIGFWCNIPDFLPGLYKILYSNYSINSNQLLFMEALHIKYHKPQLNSGLKASKELSFII